MPTYVEEQLLQAIVKAKVDHRLRVVKFCGSDCMFLEVGHELLDLYTSEDKVTTTIDMLRGNIFG